MQTWWLFGCCDYDSGSGAHENTVDTNNNNKLCPMISQWCTQLRCREWDDNAKIDLLLDTMVQRSKR